MNIDKSSHQDLKAVHNLVDHVNVFRRQGWKYDQIKNKLVKMGNSPQAADLAIAEYIERICGEDASLDDGAVKNE